MPQTKSVITFFDLYDKEVSVIHAFALLIEKKVDKNYLEKQIKNPIEYKGKLNILTAIMNKNFYIKPFIFIDDEDELAKLT